MVCSVSDATNFPPSVTRRHSHPCPPNTSYWQRADFDTVAPSEGAPVAQPDVQGSWPAPHMGAALLPPTRSSRARKTCTGGRAGRMPPDKDLLAPDQALDESKQAL